MSKIRVLIYKLDIYNLEAKTVTFQDQEKLLELVFSLVVSMNAKTLKLNIVHVQNVL